MVRFACLLVPLAIIGPAAAGSPDGLTLPIDCRPGVDCWLLRYVDHDPGPGARDYMCKGLTGDDHNGTDIAIRDLAEMAAGVEVRAAAAGVVDAVRDGMADVSVDEIGRSTIQGKECGNGIRLDHGDGWTTWYCHLRRGSLMVKEGDRVATGQPLALVGLSGDTSFPHLHFEVRRGDDAIDPFLGASLPTGCGPGERPLWAPETMAKMSYQGVLLASAGFATAAPKKDDVRRGWHRSLTLPVASPALVVWVEAYWVEPRDRVRFTMRGPNGETVLDHAVEIDQRRQRWLGFFGKPRPGDRWPAGTYAGEITLERPGADGASTVTIAPRVALVAP